MYLKEALQARNGPPLDQNTHHPFFTPNYELQMNNDTEASVRKSDRISPGGAGGTSTVEVKDDPDEQSSHPAEPLIPEARNYEGRLPWMDI